MAWTCPVCLTDCRQIAHVPVTGRWLAHFIPKVLHGPPEPEVEKGKRT